MESDWDFFGFLGVVFSYYLFLVYILYLESENGKDLKVWFSGIFKEVWIWYKLV